jgi:DNA anti-recombination protein RmuC
MASNNESETIELGGVETTSPTYEHDNEQESEAFLLSDSNVYSVNDTVIVQYKKDGNNNLLNKISIGLNLILIVCVVAGTALVWGKLDSTQQQDSERFSQLRSELNKAIEKSSESIKKDTLAHAVVIEQKISDLDAAISDLPNVINKIATRITNEFRSYFSDLFQNLIGQLGTMLQGFLADVRSLLFDRNNNTLVEPATLNTTTKWEGPPDTQNALSDNRTLIALRNLSNYPTGR